MSKLNILRNNNILSQYLWGIWHKSYTLKTLVLNISTEKQLGLLAQLIAQICSSISTNQSTVGPLLTKLNWLNNMAPEVIS